MSETRTIQVREAGRCPVAWDAMAGTAGTRFCAVCQGCVHDLSAMKAAELEALGEDPARLRLYQRADGKVMTSDCPHQAAVPASWDERAAWIAMALLVAMVAGIVAVSVFGEPIRRLFASDLVCLAGHAESTPAKKHDHRGAAPTAAAGLPGPR